MHCIPQSKKGALKKTSDPKGGGSAIIIHETLEFEFSFKLYTTKNFVDFKCSFCR